MGWLWPCPQILRPDWKGFPRTNALAYQALLLPMKEKSFITLIPGRQLTQWVWPSVRPSGRQPVGKVIKLFSSSMTLRKNKLECWSLAAGLMIAGNSLATPLG